ncbi:MAG: hypothetical protein NC300_12880, partial [Bacteroidales bacterium]|nr:hypothetical protein [Roseburia sp.]MCM1205030.1 hypothetical protein [Bacteroidales bacterium]
GRKENNPYPRRRIIGLYVIYMATKSFLKTIDIRDKNLGSSFARALFECEKIPKTNVEFKSTPVELKGDAVTDFFDSYDKIHAKH